MTSNIHQLPCGRSEHEDYGCIDCSDYPCMLWKVVRGEMKLPGQEWRADFKGYMDREAAVIDGHLTNWEGDELKPVCRLIALRKEEKK